MPIEPTPQQRAVIEHDWTRHARVLAGPGSGKSAAAVALAERLYESEPGPRLRFLTFTRAATAELAKKLLDRPGLVVEHPSTVHSFAIAALLRNPGAAEFPQPLRIPDAWEQKNLVEPQLGGLAGVALNRVRRHLIPEMSAMWESLAAEDELKIEPGERRRFLGAFHEHRWRYGYTLLAELPDLLRRALEEHSDLDGLDYAVLIIDEYQDLNACDLRLFRLLAQRGVSVIAIGDDDQSIYSFRKAAPQGIRRFLDEYQTDCDYPLTVCHRSPRKVIEWSQRVMAGDPHRLPRPALTTRNEAPDGDVALLRFAGGQSEAKGVARLIKWLQSQSVPLADILVLTRTDHNQVFSRPIREALTAVGIESTDPNAVDDLLAGRTNRQLIAHLRLLEHREDSLAWATLLKLRPQIGPSFFDFIYGRARERGTTFGQAFLAAAEDEFDGGPKGSSDRALDLVTEVITRLDGCQLPDEGDDVAWAQWIAERASDGNLPPVTDELRFLMEGVEGLIDDAPQLGRFVSQLAPLGADLERAESDCVRFMTLTGSKGLTVRATIIVGVEHDLIPRPGEDMQEERRLLFVAMTRPTEYLYLTYAGMRRGQQQRAGRGSTGRRNPSVLLQDGGVERQDGESFLKSIGA